MKTLKNIILGIGILTTSLCFGQTFNLKDTIQKYANDTNYVLEKSRWKMGNANNPSGHKNIFLIYHKGNPITEKVIKFDDYKDSLGNFVIDEGYIKYIITSSKKITKKGDYLFTSTEKYYGKRTSSYTPNTESWVENDWENLKDVLWENRNEPVCIPLSDFEDLFKTLEK